jgi:hypothetical protein
MIATWGVRSIVKADDKFEGREFLNVGKKR